MEPDPQFVEAFVHDEIRRPDGFWWRRKILGYNVRPFSIWHQALLIAVRSPLIRGEPITDPKQLLQAVYICRSIFPEARIEPPHRPFRHSFAFLGGGFQRAQSMFEEYVADYSAPPQFSVVNPPPPQGSTPPPSVSPPTAPMRIAGDLITWSHWPDERVWNLRVGVAAWYDAIALKARGNHLDFLNGDESNRWNHFAEEDPEVHAAALKAAEDFRSGKWEM